MISFINILGGVVGLAVGSFLGVVIERGMRKVSYWNGRSKCTSCRHQLAWRENIPVVSFIFLGGRCAYCHSPIPYWLPLIEIAGGAAGLAVAAQIGKISSIGLIGLILVAAAFIWIFFLDLVYGVISDWAVFVGSVGAIFYHLPFTIYHLVPAIGAAAFFWFLVVITRGRGMGMGDVTLGFFLGLFLGWPLILVGLWLAFVFGALAGIFFIAIGKKKFGQTLPFAPFLILGTLVAAQWGQTILDNWLWPIVK